ncbi:MAG: peptidase S10 [Kiritimatiellia bacterium]
MIRQLLLVPLIASGFSATAADEPKPPKDKVVFPEAVATNTVTIAGAPLTYVSTAARIPLLKDDGATRAEIFYISYTRSPAGDASKRPVTFCFNGGPGSSAVWLHLGVMGPYRVDLPPQPQPVPPPGRWVENAFSLLDRSDLVFIDPVSTGFSRAAKDEDPKQFHGVQEDIDAVAEFIRMWITRNGRWLSPKVLAGESYGTIRAAGLASRLQQQGIELNGVMLVSTVLEFQTIDFSEGNETVYPLYLPTYAANAWYHQRLAADRQAQPLEQVLAGAEAFALKEYLPALHGPQAELEGSGVFAALAGWSGLSSNYVATTGGRVQQGRFMKELLRDRGLVIGRFDGRYTGSDSEAAGDGPEQDPSLGSVRGAFTAAMNDYLRNKLGVQSDLPYEILTGRVQPWSYKPFENRYLNMAAPLATAMRQNPALKVYVASGAYDLATPYLATRITLDRMALPPALRANIRSLLYPAGHMMYTEPEVLEKMSGDMRSFIDWAVPAK